MELRQHWNLSPDVVFLNHGSFGACPRVVLETQDRWRAEMERQPVEFFARRMEGLLDQAREPLAAFIGVASDDLAFVPNTTAGINAVLRSLGFEPGDELLTTDHEYNAVGNAMRFVAARAGARVVVARIPLPLEDPEQVVQAVLGSVTRATRIAVLDHVTSPTGLVFPVERLVRELTDRGVDTLVDGAHAPGMVPLDLDRLGAAYYVGNCHKWICAPKGAGFLHVRRDRQDGIVPTSVSHGANDPRTERSGFRKLFDWTGTDDPTAYLCVPEAIRFVGSLLPGGWPGVMEANRELVLRGRNAVSLALGVEPPSPQSMVGSMAAIPLPDDTGSAPPASSLFVDPLKDVLLERWGIEVPIIPWPAWPKRLVRISAQIYNRPEEYGLLGEALAELLVVPSTGK